MDFLAASGAIAAAERREDAVTFIFLARSPALAGDGLGFSALQ